MSAAGPRRAALDALIATTAQRRFLDDALEAAVSPLADPRDRALARELAFGVCRFMPRLEAIRDALLARPLRKRDLDVGLVVALGLYQLLYTRVPDHASVAETVALARDIGKPWASGLVNAVLRRFGRESEACLARVDSDDSARLAHPPWMLRALRDAWPEQWLDVAAANNRPGPMSLRVNRRRTSADDYARRLGENEVAATALAHAPEGLELHSPVDVAVLPGFADGEVSVQDGAAQLAAHLLDVRAGQRVLDACAAPGGKSAHILELEPDLDALVALDIDDARMARLEDTMTRLGLEAHLLCADACKPQSWWDGKPFDRILVDAPCSATGVVRRHPDIKLRPHSSNLEALCQRQLELLRATWPLLARDGLLLYATCSVMPVENASLVQRFLDAHPDARARPLDVCWGIPSGEGRQILPGDAGMDSTLR